MTDDREPFREARAAGLKARHEQRLENATYTAAEVKVLTAEAREDAAEEIARAILATADRYVDYKQRDVVYDMERLAREIGSKEASA